MSMIICPEYGALISSRANSCVKCGLPIKEIKICPEYGKTVLEKTDMFCLECGYPFKEEKINLDKEDKKFLETITDI